MLKKSLLALALVAGVALAAAALSQSKASADTDAPAANEQPAAEETASAPEEKAPASVKEFTMTSFVEFADGKPKPQFSLKEITVRKGDLVRLKITNTKGKHDFNLDEFGIHAPTELDTEAVVEFTADTAGQFTYYCSMPGHRANGHWGTLTVLE